jgi:hypothetical protein
MLSNTQVVDRLVTLAVDPSTTGNGLGLSGRAASVPFEDEFSKMEVPPASPVLEGLLKSVGLHRQRLQQKLQPWRSKQHELLSQPWQYARK